MSTSTRVKDYSSLDSRVCDVFEGEQILLAGTRHFRSLTIECACLLS